MAMPTVLLEYGSNGSFKRNSIACEKRRFEASEQKDASQGKAGHGLLSTGGGSDHEHDALS